MILHFSEILLSSTPSHKTIFFYFHLLGFHATIFLGLAVLFFFLPPPPAFFFFCLCCCSALGASTAQEQEGQENHSTKSPSRHSVLQNRLLNSISAASKLLRAFASFTLSPLPPPPPPFFFSVFVCCSFAGSGGPERKTQTLYFEICGYFSSRSQPAAFNILPEPAVGFQGKDLLPLLLSALLPHLPLVRSFHPRALRPSAPPGPLAGGGGRAALARPPSRRAGVCRAVGSVRDSR